MAGRNELDNFVKKFVSLWQSGCDASLHVETKAGNAFVSLHLGLGQAQPHHGQGLKARGQGCRVGSPSKQRRKERREAERVERAAAEQEDIEENKTGTNENVEVAEKDAAPTEAEYLEYELKIGAHEKCKNYDVCEAIEVNFDGALDNLKVEKCDQSRDILVQKLEKEELKDEEAWNIVTYRVKVRSTEVAKNVIESWKDRFKFDDLAFGNSVYGVVRVRVFEVHKVG